MKRSNTCGGSDYSCTTGVNVSEPNVLVLACARRVTPWACRYFISSIKEACVFPCWRDHSSAWWAATTLAEAKGSLNWYFYYLFLSNKISCLTDSGVINFMATLSCWSNQQRSSEIPPQSQESPWSLAGTSAAWRRNVGAADSSPAAGGPSWHCPCTHWQELGEGI